MVCLFPLMHDDTVLGQLVFKAFMVYTIRGKCG